jgi:hypothetical protein
MAGGVDTRATIEDDCAGEPRIKGELWHAENVFIAVSIGFAW